MKLYILIFFLLLVTVLLACRQKLNENLLIGKWQYERMTTGNMQTSSDTLVRVTSELEYAGSVLQFFEDATFVMTNKDTASGFQGNGTYTLDAKESTLTMEGNVKNTLDDKMKVRVLELTADSLKLGQPNEMLVYSRLKN